ncbi:hypothetical protein JXB02_00305 [Candidatus Woesearchaeota archaeon]|nr:hypothetical protein [Candidatus Woesearchaeota archaeon]
MAARAIDVAQTYANETLNLALDTVRKEKQALFFVNAKRSAEKTAEDIAKRLKETADLERLAGKALHDLPHPTKQCERLAGCLKKGIAFHHAGLTAGQRQLVEESFRKGMIRIIACTPTLAAGLDLPAFRAIIKDLKRYGGRWGMQPIPVLEYLQMAGRAGRPTFDDYGEAICIAASDAEKEEIIESYINGRPEAIYSKLAVEPVLRTYVLSLVATRVVRSREGLVGFFAESFWAHQYKDLDRIAEIIGRMLALLEEWEFVTLEGGPGSGFVSADELGTGKVTATRLGERVAQLYLDPLTAHYLIGCLQRATESEVSPFALLQMMSSTNEMVPPLRVKVRELDEINQRLAENEHLLLADEPTLYDPEYDDFLASVKTALFFMDWIDEKDEDYLLEQYGIRAGEIHAKREIADWLCYSCEELCKLLSFPEARSEVTKLRFRLKYGAKEELFPLLRLRNIGRVRARRLFANRIRDVGDIKRAPLMTLSQLVGRKTAEDVKKQVGQEVGEVPAGKRKGQTGLGKY